MNCLNRVELIGYVGAAPQVATTFENGDSILTLSLATGDKEYVRKDGTVVPERTDWHNITIKGALTKFVSQYINKGDRLYIEGRMRQRSYTKDNVERKITEIIANNIIKLSSGSRIDNEAINQIKSQFGAEQV